MFFAILAFALWAVLATIEVVRRDGYRPVPYYVDYDSRLAGPATSVAWR